MTKRKSRTAVLEAPSSPQVRPGLVSPRRTVPKEIGRPEYASTGQPSVRTSRAVRTPDEIERMRVAGRLAAEVLSEAGKAVAPGMTADEIDGIVHEATIERDAYPSPLNYRGYPK